MEYSEVKKDLDKRRANPICRACPEISRKACGMNYVCAKLRRYINNALEI